MIQYMNESDDLSSIQRILMVEKTKPFLQAVI